jgi:hypothetical protein
MVRTYFKSRGVLPHLETPAGQHSTIFLDPVFKSSAGRDTEEVKAELKHSQSQVRSASKQLTKDLPIKHKPRSMKLRTCPSSRVVKGVSGLNVTTSEVAARCTSSGVKEAQAAINETVAYLTKLNLI